MSSHSTYKGTILIVDDLPANVAILFSVLKGQGFKVLVAQDGKRALQTAETTHPDLILLDIMMPGMDGFEVCHILKSQATTSDIPIIFMTAMADTADKVHGFTLGAADYITKPIQHEEVVARVTAQLNLHRLKRELQERTCQLEKSNLELQAFARTVAHDLKNPLNAIINITAVVSEDDSLNRKAQERLYWVSRAGQQMLTTINALLLLAGVAQQGNIEMQAVNMATIIEQVLYERLDYMMKEYHAKVQLPETWPVAQGYAPWIAEIWTNYISNALKYGGRPPCLVLGSDEIPCDSPLAKPLDKLKNIPKDHTIKEEPKQFVRFWIRDNGQGLTLDEQSLLFTPFSRLRKDHVEGHGLGLSIVRQIIEKLGGYVGVESEPGQGSLFFFTLPAE